MRITRQRAFRITCIALIAALASAAQARAQFTVIHSFGGPTPVNTPFNPNAIIQGADGNFYGTSSSGGDAGFHGTVFRMTPGGAVTIIYTFTGMDDSSNPIASLVQARDGNFYGTTPGSGGSTVNGTIFRMTPGGTLTTLHTFSGTDGRTPYAGLIEGADGNLYGVTQFGGTFNGGVAYRITTNGTFTPLYSFGTDPNDGRGPRASLVQGFDGNFYGTCVFGGPANAGTVFKMTAAGVVTTFHAFTGATSDGSGPTAPLTQALDGNLYGTTNVGGAFNRGTVFRLSLSGAFTQLHSFTGGVDGAFPTAPLLQSSDLSFYSTTQFGPEAPALNGPGVIFRMAFDGTVTNMHTFTVSDGLNPLVGLTHATDGNFYGTVLAAGPNNSGTAYRLDNPASCDDTLRLSYTGGTLNLGFTLKSTTAATWSTWLLTPVGSPNIWSLSIPAVVPAASFTIPIAGFPNVGDIFVLTVLNAGTTLCADLKSVRTGS